MGHRGRTARRAGALALVAFFALVQAAPMAAAGSSGAGGTPAVAAPDAKIERGLLKALETKAVDRFIVEFTAKANLAGAARIVDRTKRTRTVFDSLRKTATTAQVGARAVVARTPGARAESYWLTNVMLVHGDAALATKLAALPSVRVVRQEKVFPLVKPIDPKVVVDVGETPEWGVAKIGADQVWAEGITRPGRRRRDDRHRRRLHPPRPRRALPRQQRRRLVHPRLQLVGPDRHLRRRALRQRRPRHPHDGHDRRRRRPRPVHARHRRRPGRRVDRGQGLRGLRLQRGRRCCRRASS